MFNQKLLPGMYYHSCYCTWNSPEIKEVERAPVFFDKFSVLLMKMKNVAHLRFEGLYFMIIPLIY